MRTATCATPYHFRDLANHFLELDPKDRFLRFGRAVTDAWIIAYVEGLLRSDDAALVVGEPLRGIPGVLHLESIGSSVILGLSVSPRSRGLGIGTLLLQRAVLLARARQLNTLFVRNLGSNADLQRLALRLGLSVACAPIATTTSLELRAAKVRDAGCAATITLADDSLRPQDTGAPTGMSLADLQRPIL